MPTGTRPLPSPLSHEVGRLLIEAISRQPLPQGRIADAAGMSASQLSRALTGKKVFTLDQLDAVCTAVGVDLVDVVSRADRATRGGELIAGRFGVDDHDQDDLGAVARRRDPEPTDEQ